MDTFIDIYSTTIHLKQSIFLILLTNNKEKLS